jgi:hypothetical protein
MAARGPEAGGKAFKEHSAVMHWGEHIGWGAKTLEGAGNMDLVFMVCFFTFMYAVATLVAA